MKKIITALVCLTALFCFAGCDLLGTNSEPETTIREVVNIPEFDDIESRLSAKGYTVTYTDTAGNYPGKGIVCVKDEDYLEMYRLDNMEDCSALMDDLEKIHGHADKCVSIAGDPKLGNLVFIGSKQALILADVQYDNVVEKVE